MHARTHRPLRHDQPRHAAEEAEHPHMRADPIRQRLCEGRLRIGVAGGAEHADEELGVAHNVGAGVNDDVNALAQVIDE
jgi:uncharacterized protein YijF (DUF1287 family)